MRRAIFPGSFDPPTNGHLDIIKRSLPLFDEIIIAVLNNPDKHPLFTVEERCDMIREILPSVMNGGCDVTVDSFSGLTADFARRSGATAIIRGIRAVSDYEYELRMALMNRKLEPTIETVFLMADEEYSYVSSTLMKQVFMLGGRVAGLIPELVEDRMRETEMIIGIHHAQITIPKDAEVAAREFYCELLGMTEIPKPSELDGRGGFWLEVGDRQIHLGTEDNADRESTKAHIAYLVKNLDGWRRTLEMQNISVVDGIQIPNYRRFEFRDPFGNRIEFMQPMK